MMSLKVCMRKAEDLGCNIWICEVELLIGVFDPLDGVADTLTRLSLDQRECLRQLNLPGLNHFMQRHQQFRKRQTF
jgi:hypothetical protein